MAVTVGSPITLVGDHSSDDFGGGYFNFAAPTAMAGRTFTSALVKFTFDWPTYSGFVTTPEWKIDILTASGTALRSWTPPSGASAPLAFSTPEVITCTWQSGWDAAPIPVIDGELITVNWSIPASAGIAPDGWSTAVAVEITFYEAWEEPAPPVITIVRDDAPGDIDQPSIAKVSGNRAVLAFWDYDVDQTTVVLIDKTGAELDRVLVGPTGFMPFGWLGSHPGVQAIQVDENHVLVLSQVEDGSHIATYQVHDFVFTTTDTIPTPTTITLESGSATGGNEWFLFPYDANRAIAIKGNEQVIGGGSGTSTFEMHQITFGPLAKSAVLASWDFVRAPNNPIWAFTWMNTSGGAVLARGTGANSTLSLFDKVTAGPGVITLTPVTSPTSTYDFARFSPPATTGGALAMFGTTTPSPSKVSTTGAILSASPLALDNEYVTGAAPVTLDFTGSPVMVTQEVASSVVKISQAGGTVFPLTFTMLYRTMEALILEDHLILLGHDGSLGVVSGFAILPTSVDLGPGPCHVYHVVSDAEGNLSGSVDIEVYYPGTTTLVSEPLFLDKGLTVPTPPTLRVIPGVISLWTEKPLRVDINVSSVDAGDRVLYGKDFHPSPLGALWGGDGYRIEPGGAQPGWSLSRVAAGVGGFTPIDIESSHMHLDETASSVVLVSLADTPGAPLARPVTRPLLPGLGQRLEVTPFGPGRSPSSVILLALDPGLLNSQTWFGGADPITNPNNPLLSTVGIAQVLDPTGDGRNVVVGTVRQMFALASRSVLLGSDFAFSSNVLDYTIASTLRDPRFSRAVAVGHWLGYCDLSVRVGSYFSETEGAVDDVYGGLHPQAWSGVGVVVVGQRSSYNSPTGKPGGVVVGSRSDILTEVYPYQWDGYWPTDAPMFSDVFVGHFRSGVGDSAYCFFPVARSATVIAPNIGYPEGADPTDLDDVPATLMRYSNSIWSVAPRYLKKRRDNALTGTIVDLLSDHEAALVDASAHASVAVLQSTIPAPPAALNYWRTDWKDWGIVAPSMRMFSPPVADRDDMGAGAVILTHPNTRVPGDLMLGGDVTIGAPTHDGTGGVKGKVGFYGATAVERPKVVDDASIPALTSLVAALASLGLVLSPDVPVVADSFGREVLRLDNADTGQGPAGFPFVFENNSYNLGCDGATLGWSKPLSDGTWDNPTLGSVDATPWAWDTTNPWSSALYYTDLFDVVAEVTLVTLDNSSGTGGSWTTPGDDGILIRAVPDEASFATSNGQNFTYALLAARSGLYQRNPGGTKTLIAAYSTAAVDGDVLRIEADARDITVKVNGSTVLTHTLPDDQGGLMHGLAMGVETRCADLSISPL